MNWGIFSFDISDGLRGATDHPIHIHGHSFHVLKTSYPELDPTTGLVTNFSRDIECESETCLKPRWSNKEWAGGNLPDLNLRNPPLKDTVVVPRGGYVVLRFYLDNPGMISRFSFDNMIFIDIHVAQCVIFNKCLFYLWKHTKPKWSIVYEILLLFKMVQEFQMFIRIIRAYWFKSLIASF